MSPDKLTNKVFINDAWCKNCLICREFCPHGVFELEADSGRIYVAQPEKCISCGICQLLCPDFAITLEEKDNEF